MADVLCTAAGLLETDHPGLADQLRGLAPEADVGPAQPLPRRAVRLRLLGRIEVVHPDGCHPVTGRPAELLALLALGGPAVPVEGVIDALWPDSCGRRGRERLRTVLARTRREVGDVVRRGEDTLRLHGTVGVDHWEFVRLADRALAGDGTDPAADAGAALAMFDPRLAPGLEDRHWLARPRRRHHHRGLALHDRVADGAEDADRPLEAVAALLAAIEIEPTAEHRAVRAARLLAAAGQAGRALDLLGRVRHGLRDADLVPTDELERLAGYLVRSARLA